MSFDYKMLLETAGGDEELVKELIEIFGQECPEMMASIEQAIRANQPQQLHEAAHKIKGPLGNMGAYAALDQVVALETMGINKDLQQADIAFSRLTTELETLLAELNKHERSVTE